MKTWNLQPPTLEKFQIKEGAALYNYFIKEIFIPSVPSKPEYPSLLLYDIQNLSHKNREVYKFIDENQEYGPIGLYGTSGAGKTRTVFEYLAHNYGFYFVADTQRNPGSGDVGFLIHKSLSVLETSPTVAESDGDKKERCFRNHITFSNLLDTLVGVRFAVFQFVNAQLKENRNSDTGLSSHEWLLLQLYPKKFLGGDVFLHLCEHFLPVGLQGYQKERKMSCFVDEGQVLLQDAPQLFSSSDGTEDRTFYYAFVKGLVGLAKADSTIENPCFSGTGLSIDAMRSETRSFMVKPGGGETPFYSSFPTLSPSDVVDYLKIFLNLDEVGGDLIEHVAKWLRGRPRWSATFLETFFQRNAKDMKCRGCLQEKERPLMDSLQRFIEVTTESSFETKKRHSWSMGETSPFEAVKHLFDKTGTHFSEAQRELRKAAFDFSLSGIPSFITAQAAELIQQGIAPVATDGIELASHIIKCRIDEPLIIQACLNLFGFEITLTERFGDTLSDSEKGSTFEFFLLPGIRRHFSKLLANQLKANYGDLKYYKVPKLSSYGVVAFMCKTSDDTIKWIERASKSRLEGQVEPFCYPDQLFGPDLVFLMWTSTYNDFRFVAAQVKLKNGDKTAAALRTLVPELFYRNNRILGAKGSSCSLKGDALKDWEDLEERFFQYERSTGAADTTQGSARNQAPIRKRKRGIVRFVVQYPAELTKSARPGPVHFSNYKALNADEFNDATFDRLVSVDKRNIVMLLGEEGLAILKAVKGI